MARCFLHNALPLVADAEEAVKDKCLAAIEELVLGPVLDAQKELSAAESSDGSARQLAVKEPSRAFPVLEALAAAPAAAGQCSSKALALLAQRKRLSEKKLAPALQRIIASAYSPAGALAGAWMILADLSCHSSEAIQWDFLMARWEELRKKEPGARALGAENLLLQTMANSSARFPPEKAAELCEQLLHLVQSFALPAAAIACHVEALNELTRRHSPTADHADKIVATWCGRVFSAVSEVLHAFVESGKGSSDKVTAALFTAGELALLCPTAVAPKASTLVQALVVPSLSHGEVPGSIQAHAWTSLGKLCLVNETLAKSCLPLMVQELHKSTSAAARNNIMVALTDLCVKYTALVDAHLPRLAACLRDPCELVRRQTLLLLAGLLQREYVKWRGQLLFRFLLALVDESAAVRELAEFLLGDMLASKAPLLAYNSFVEAVFVLNDCRAHAGYAGPATSAAEDVESSERFSLKGSGAVARGRRQAVYAALLRRLSPEHKLSTTGKLCVEVLGGIVDGQLPLEACQEVLLDALSVLASKDIKVSAARAPEEDDESPAAAANAAKGKLVSAMMKKNLMVNVVPVLIELKRMLEEAQSPLLGYVMECVRALLKDYKAEVEDILVADKQLAKEILHDMRQAEAAKRLSMGQGKPASPAGGGGAAGRTPAGLTPRGGRTLSRSSSAASPRSPGGARAALPVGTSVATPVAAALLAEAEGTRRGSMGAATPGAAGRRTPGAGLGGDPAGSPAAGSMSVPRLLSASRTPRAGGPSPGGAGAAGPSEARRLSQSFSREVENDGSESPGGTGMPPPPPRLPRSHTPGKGGGEGAGAAPAAERRPLEGSSAANRRAPASEEGRKGGADIVLFSPDKPSPARKWNLEEKSAPKAAAGGGRRKRKAAASP